MHIKHDLSIAHIFCSVLQLSKQQKPQNSEAVTYIIAKASRPICKHPIVETTKPPTYLFRYLAMSKSKKRNEPTAPHSWRRQPISSPIPTSAPCGPSASRCGVCRCGEGYLGRGVGGRKRLFCGFVKKLPCPAQIPNNRWEFYRRLLGRHGAFPPVGRPWHSDMTAV